MLANRCMDNTAVEQDLRRVRNSIEDGQGFLEFLIVVVTEGFYPSLDFLLRVREEGLSKNQRNQPV